MRGGELPRADEEEAGAPGGLTYELGQLSPEPSLYDLTILKKQTLANQSRTSLIGTERTLTR